MALSAALSFAGCDYNCSVSLDGVPLGNHTGSFVGFEGDGPQETQARDVRKLGWGRGSATGGHSGGSNRRFIELNHQLMNAPDPAALVQLVEGHAAEFNQVNATTALQRLMGSFGLDGGRAR